ncbi:MAG: aminotransferase class III-fold pyridoxal phosphate-dependent enzyme, partial [Gemmatimonadota bacterium]|nr:aminotransferase class III-fold pyridoxal phosphate-dependent enzyme [Gemmatimonadota bacterium]
LGALAVTDREHFRVPFVDRLTPHVSFVPFPEDLGRGLDAVERILASDSIGAVIIEPIQGRGGVRIPPTGFLPGLLEAAHRHGALVVFDEIFTGLGRTGRRFAGEWEGTVPDVLCLGKALGGGLPLSACVAPAAIMDAWPPSSGEAVHTSTFLGHPLGCASGLAFLRVLEDERLADRADTLGQQMLSELGAALAAGPPRKGGVEVRGRGLMIGVELPEPGAGVEAARNALAQGLIALPAGPEGRVLELTPPAVLTPDQVRRGLEIVVDAVTGVL